MFETKKKRTSLHPVTKITKPIKRPIVEKLDQALENVIKKVNVSLVIPVYVQRIGNEIEKVHNRKHTT